ncbi:hypothetical protein [Larkinella soli]|uniref:hypothetical protein n=1 Tax=Larkinella soli TaxID=1770527 RepID=UPI000FFBE390|nr:hypothetical protein [Larkinella soli]
MQRRHFPSVLLYGFGLALALSLVFNGFLLYERSRRPGWYDDEFSHAAGPAETGLWQQELTDCRRANLQKDSLIRRLEQLPDAPPGQAAAVPSLPK